MSRNPLHEHGGEQAFQVGKISRGRERSAKSYRDRGRLTSCPLPLAIPSSTERAGAIQEFYLGGVELFLYPLRYPALSWSAHAGNPRDLASQERFAPKRFKTVMAGRTPSGRAYLLRYLRLGITSCPRRGMSGGVQGRNRTLASRPTGSTPTALSVPRSLLIR